LKKIGPAQMCTSIFWSKAAHWISKNLLSQQKWHNKVKNDVKLHIIFLAVVFVKNAHDISITPCEDVRGVL